MSRSTFQRIAVAAIVVCLIALIAPGIINADQEHDKRDRVSAHEHDRHTVRQTSSADTRSDVFLDRTFTVSEGDYLTVELASSDVLVETGTSSQAQVVITGRGSDAAEEFERRRFSADYTNRTLSVKFDPESRPTLRRIEASFDVTVTIPEHFDVKINSASGDVQLGDLRGQLEIGTASGDIQLGALDGTELTIHTASGDVSADALVGILDVSTASGDLEISTVTGYEVSISTASGNVSVDQLSATTFETSTASGNIELGHFDADADVHTASGNVSITFDHILPASIQTLSGNVDLYLPTSANAGLELTSSNIDIDDTLSFRGQRDRRRVRGDLGSGGPLLSVTTQSGNINLEQN